jgi:uncharacterized SAM-binding protein YcdF (DUF218 family)
MSDLRGNHSSAATAAEKGVGTPAAATTDPNATRGSARLWRAGLRAAAVLGVILLLTGFVGFAERIARATPPVDPHADAIVVLTGGSARIDGALQLLAEHRATRLLISGVNPRVNSSDLARLVGGDLRDDLACCVDLGHDAIDTIGNAAETRSWAKERGFSSLIVVTSDYHMPRSMTELAGAMPDVELIPFPVSNPDLRFADWWRDPPTLALLVREYGKYLLAKARRLLPATTEATAQTGAAG